MERLKRVSNVSPETKERSKELIVLELKDGKFAVSSYSRPNRGYLVTEKDGCECEGYGWRGDCAHLARLEAFLAGE